MSTEYVPSPHSAVADQVALFESTDGAQGNTMGGLPIVVLTMRGARTGKVRKVPLMRVEHDGSYAAVASKGGAPEHPVWYRNLVANPSLQVQDGATRTPMRARELSGDERETWWQRAVSAFPPYAEYATKTDRQIPVFALEPEPS